MSSRIAVLVPVHNAREWLAEAVRSILDQTHRDLEVLVVDDGSTDGSLEALAGFSDPRLEVLVLERNQGKSTALNRALASTDAPFFALQDADDVSHPGRIEAQVRALEANVDVCAVFCGHDLILGGRRVAPRLAELDRDGCAALVERMTLPAHDPTAVFRRSLVEDLSFDESLPVAQGLDFILRVGERDPMLVLGECLYSYRVRSGSRTRTSIDLRQECVLRVLEAACSRRGLPPGIARERARPWISAEPRAQDNNLAAHFIESVLDLRRAGRLGAAVRTALTCSARRPGDPHHHKPLVYSLLPLWMGQRLRGHRRRDPVGG